MNIHLFFLFLSLLGCSLCSVSVETLRDNYQELKVIYTKPYFEICKDNILNQKFQAKTYFFSLRIDYLFKYLKDQIPVLNSLFVTFDKTDDFWIFFWISHLQTNFKSDFSACQTLLFKNENFSSLYKTETNRVLDRIVRNIRFYIEKLKKENVLYHRSESQSINFAISGLESQLEQFEEYRGGICRPTM
jgi:hypothetical protein